MDHSDKINRKEGNIEGYVQGTVNGHLLGSMVSYISGTICVDIFYLYD